MIALCVEIASVTTSITTTRSQATVGAAFAFAIIGVMVNVITIALLELWGRRVANRRALHFQGWVFSAGALWPVLALACLFVGTQPIAFIAVAGGGSFLMVMGFVAVVWFV